MIRPARVLMLSPLIWVCGFMPIACQALMTAAGISRLRRLLRPSAAESALILFSLAYALSLALAAVRGEDNVRVIGGFYNLSFWIMGLFIVAMRADYRVEPMQRAAALILSLTLAVTITASVVADTGDYVWYPSLFSSIVNIDGMPQNIRDNSTLKIMVADWSTFGLGSRPSVLSPYPTAFAALVFLLACLGWPLRRGWYRIVYFPVVLPLAVIAASFMAASRALAVAFLVYLVVLLYTHLLAGLSGLVARLALVLLALGLCIGALGLLSPGLESMWVAVNTSRADSSALRFLVYERSANEVLANHPLLGYGIKGYDDSFNAGDFVIPIGSHSTFVGALHKTGILGLSLLLAFVFQVMKKAMSVLLSPRSTGFDRSIASGLVAFPIAMAFDDIDAMPLVSFIYFIMVALVTQRATELSARTSLP